MRLGLPVILSLAICCAVQVSAQLPVCGTNWEQFNDKCYWFASFEVTREEAYMECNSRWSHLITVDTMVMSDWLARKALEYSFWIGLRVSNEIDQNSNWHWDDGSATVYTKWPSPEGNVPCAAIITNSNWGTYGCSFKFNYICKKPKGTGACGTLWEEYNNHCYFHSRDMISNMQAARICQDGPLNANLVSIHSEAENTFVTNMLQGTNAWIGFYPLRWDDGTVYSRHQFEEFTVPSNTKPAVIQNPEHLWLASESNKDKYRFICQTGANATLTPTPSPPATTTTTTPVSTTTPTTTPVSTTTPPTTTTSGVPISCDFPFERFGDTCYYFSGQTDRITWDAARVQCNFIRTGATIVTVDSRSVYDYVHDKMDRAQPYEYHIGLRQTDMLQPTNWYWSDGSANVWWQWTTPPTNSPCGLIETNGPWGNTNCGTSLPWVCKKLRTGPSCDFGWTEFGGYCYYHDRDTGLTNMAAANDCFSRGAILASILSNAENTHITNLINFRSWIGLYALRWEDDTAYNYHEFSPFGGPQFASQCHWTQNDIWVANNCDSAIARYVCQYGVGPAPTTTTTTTMPTTTTASSGDCPLGYERFGNKCYSFSGDLDIQTWVVAKQYCAVVAGAVLATVDSQETFDYIHGRIGTSNYHIGLMVSEDITSPLSWYWSDGSSNTYSQWNQPPNTSPCGVMFNTGAWWSQTCSLPLAFVCKKPASGSQCDFGWSFYNNNCYYHDPSDTRTNMDAADYCRDRGAALVSIQSQNENSYVSGLVAETVWIGLYALRWEDNTPYHFHRYPYIGGPTAGQPCTVTRTGNWEAIECNVDAARYVCQTEPGSCQDGWDYFEGNCYYFDKEEVTREHAASVCTNITSQSRQSSLVTIDSPNVFGFLVNKNLNYDFWIGLRVSPDLNSDDNWYWSNSHLNMWTKWNRPSTNNPCVELRTNGDWGVYTCLASKHYICKKPKSGTCPSDWVTRDDWCYQLNTNGKGSLYAELDCLDKDAHLASIHSEEENTFLSTMIIGNTWIGLYGLLWEDGTTLSWHAFPTYGGPLVYQPCVRQTQTGEWVADYCESALSLHGFVCQTSASGNKRENPQKRATVSTFKPTESSTVVVSTNKRANRPRPVFAAASTPLPRVSSTNSQSSSQPSSTNLPSLPTETNNIPDTTQAASTLNVHLGLVLFAGVIALL